MKRFARTTGALLALSLATCSDNPLGVMVKSIVVTPDTVVVGVGASVQLAAVALDGSGAQVTGAAILFSVADTTVARTTTYGLVTGVAAGKTAVFATSGSAVKGVPVVVDLAPRTAASSVLVDARPFGAAVSSQGVIYTTQQDADSLTRIRLSDLAVTGHVSVGRDPGDVVFSSDGATAWVTNFIAGTVGIVNVASGTMGTTDTLPSNAYRILLSKDGSRLWVTCGDGTLRALNPATLATLAIDTVGPAPNGIASRGDTTLYVSLSGSGTIVEVNLKTNTVLRRLSDPGTPQDIAVSPDGTELYIANEAGKVDVMTLASGAITRSITVTSGGPFGLGLAPDGRYLYVSVASAGQVLAIDRIKRQIIATVNVGGVPRRIAFDPAGTAVVIPNEGGYVAVLR